MIVIPAIDLKEGRCVRLLQGRMDQESVYSEDPVGMAEHWESKGREEAPRGRSQRSGDRESRSIDP